ncbi:MAG: PfkB family carbohydrate kinase [Pseudomonadota bacterium]
MTAPRPRSTRDVLCIGSVLWDVIGRSRDTLRIGSDMPGRISRIPGGVAMNIAMTLRRFDMTPILLSAVGRDPEGEELLAASVRLGIETSYVYRSEELPTDRYMAIEDANGVVAALADAHSLEAAGANILAPLRDGRLGSEGQPYSGLVALDGNLTEALLAEIAESPLFTATDLRVAPASPGKAKRLRPLLGCPRGVLYVNLEEAGLLAGQRFSSAAEAGTTLVDNGATRVIVSDGGRTAADCTRDRVTTATPPKVQVARVTGAGDTLMAAHIAAETEGQDPQMALECALAAAASYVSGDVLA